jgi:RIO-like serine/threonine protein kinase
MTAVLYQPLPGETLRQIASKEGFNWQQSLPALVGLIRSLHASGIYFRSLHLGNIVVTPDNRMGLIDVADMRFLRRPLPKYLIRRNLQHFARYIDREKLNDSFPMQALEQALLPS